MFFIDNKVDIQYSFRVVQEKEKQKMSDQSKVDYGNVDIRVTGMGLEVLVFYKSDLGSRRFVTATVSKAGINLAATAELNQEGIQALKDCTAMADILYRQKFG